ncbi:TSUP family transporter [Oleiharenicola lentus]|uniref:TSUP family transporter n=1 Tax=Oleiharenicola lentus TaxID=2508720 RepID=UPI003F67C5DF
MPSIPEITLLGYVLLFGAGLVAGTVDAIAGGGGLITLPALLSAGLPVPFALGSNKLASAFGTASATWSYARRGAFKLSECKLGIACTFAGAALGAMTVRMIDPSLLARVIPWLLGAMVIYFTLKPQLGEGDRQQRLSETPFYLIFGLALGFYDGFFGPGAGSFWTIAFIMVLGHNFVKAAGHTKAMNLSSNLAGVLVFGLGGKILLLPALAVGAGNLLGARFGAHLAMTRGAKFVRPVFLVMAALVALKLIYTSYVS